MRKIVIYIDILLGINLYITWLLLLAAEKLSGMQPRLWRKVLAAALGSASSLMILLPPLSDLVSAAIKLLSGILLAVIAFGFSPLRRFCKALFWFYGANFLFLGCATLLWMLLEPPRLALRNGFVYYHISALSLILATIAAYSAVRAIAWLSARKLPQNTLRCAAVTVGGDTVSLTVFYDSGNRLYSLSGLPVVICFERRLAALLPPELLSAGQDPSLLSALPKSWSSRVELIPCSSVGGEKLLPAFRPDRFSFDNAPPLPCLIALSPTPFLDGEADAIGGEGIFHFE